MIRNASIVAVLLAVSACGGTPRVAMAPTVEQAPGNVMPPPEGINADGTYNYVLGALDKISIEVDGMPDLLREAVVDGQGMVSYPMAGPVRAAGLTTTELARALEARMQENYVRDPRVNVNLVEVVSQLVTVDGQVNQPGLYPVYQDMTLMQAVAVAKGETDFARTSAVLIFREAGDLQYVGLYDLGAIRRGNYADPKVYPGDRIVVGEAEARRILQLVGPFISLVTTPLIYLINRNR